MSLWRGNHVAVSDLIDYYPRYLYLQRVTGPDVILEAVSGAVSLLSWQYEGFAYAEAYDEKAARYVGLRQRTCAAVVIDAEWPGGEI